MDYQGSEQVSPLKCPKDGKDSDSAKHLFIHVLNIKRMTCPLVISIYSCILSLVYG